MQSARPLASFKKLLPLFDRVLVQRAEALTKTKSGIVIPEKAQGKVLQATVVAVGPGARNTNGDLVPPLVKVSFFEKILLVVHELGFRLVTRSCFPSMGEPRWN